MTFWRRLLLLFVLGGCVHAMVARAEDPTRPTFRTLGGALIGASLHNYFVESEMRLPLLHIEPVSVYYRYRETTPFLDLNGSGPQAELLYTRYELQVDFKLNDWFRLIGVGGYHSTYSTDRTGKLSAFVLGGGIGSPFRSNGERVAWHFVGGGYLDRNNFNQDWWSDGSFSWRVIDFAQDQYLGSDYRASIIFVADVESANNADRFQALYKIGPEVQLHTAFGNRANLQLRWYHNDHNPSLGLNDNGFLFGLEVMSSMDSNLVFHARDDRLAGWLPLIWGGYDVGASGSRRVSRFEMNVELVDFHVAEHPFTGFIWYESRQEHRIGDFDNIAYSVSLGLQTPVGLESPLSHGDPLVFGADFVHRSDHSLNPGASRTAVIGTPTVIGDTTQNLIDHGSLNMLPRLRLQTLGWDLPYRDPTMYERRTDWLNFVDWRVTAGLTVRSSRHRGDFSGQLGANWDIATVQGYVVYLRALGSVGNETPDWQGEAGVRRPAGKVFARYESYHMKATLAQGDAFIVGVGVYL
jgi:hypothetical protein